MTKDRIKFLIDNRNEILNELSQKLENLNIEINDDSVETIFTYLEKHCSDILEKYHLDFKDFGLMYSIVNTGLEAKEMRESFLGIEEYNQILKDIIDIYGNTAYEILGCNTKYFSFSEIEGILLDDNNKKYEEFYINLLNQKCEQAQNIKALFDIISNVKPEYLSPKLIELFLKNPSKKIYEISDESSFSLIDFVENAPVNIINGDIIKKLVERDGIVDIAVLKKIPEELFDEEFSRSLLEKSAERNLEVFDLLPDKVKTKTFWEFAISKDSNIILQLPEQRINDEMTDEEYKDWCNQLVLNEFKTNHSLDFFKRLKPYLKTKYVYSEISREVKNERLKYFIKDIPQALYDDIVTQMIYETDEKERIITIYNSTTPSQITESIWNAFYDKDAIISLEDVSVQNITIEMCEKAFERLENSQVPFMPTVDRNPELIDNAILKEKYKKWLEKFSEEEKNNYRDRYEKIIIDSIVNSLVRKKSYNRGGIFDFIPVEAISTNMIKKYLEINGPQIDEIPIPNEYTKYNEQFEDILLFDINCIKRQYSVNGIEKEKYLDKIPKEFITDRVLLEGIRTHQSFLNNANIERDDYEELLQIGFKEKLESIGRTELTDKEIELIKKFVKNNSTLFTTLNLDMLNPEIVNIIGENNLERIVRYIDVQNEILKLSNNKEAFITFGIALDYLKKDNPFIQPLIEKISNSVLKAKTYNYSKSKYENCKFLNLVASRVEDKSKPLTDEEKIVISYLALNPTEAEAIENYDDVLNYVKNNNEKYDTIVNSQDASLVELKHAYLMRTTGISYKNAISLVNKYGNDVEQLLEKYEKIELATYKEKAEREALMILIKIKSLMEENDLDIIREEYYKFISSSDLASKRLEYSLLIDDILKRAYGRDFSKTLAEQDKENNEEKLETTEDGREYLVRKIHSPFKRMISVMDAYRESKGDGNLYDKWNTREMADNHALCFSLIDDTNPGNAKKPDKESLIISIKGFVPEALNSLAPYDLISDSRKNTTTTSESRPQAFYTANNLPNMTRKCYSEVVVELQDVASAEYKKIQIDSIICFEEIDEESINAAITLSEKLGKRIPIELIDRRELAQNIRAEIDDLVLQFKSGDKLQPELIEQIITKFNNVRNAHLISDLADELLGMESDNPEAIFHVSQLNKMLKECLEETSKRIENGNSKEILETISSIKQIIKNEREKYVLEKPMYHKQIWSGIDWEIDCKIDDMLRTYSIPEITEDLENESLELLQENNEIDSPTFEAMYKEYFNSLSIENETPDIHNFLEKQLSFEDFCNVINIAEMQSVVSEIHNKGYYKDNKRYSEEHITRVAMFANAIANLDGTDNQIKKLLSEAVKYYSCGRVLDYKEEPHQEYSAKIAGKELAGKYSSKDIGIIQAVIELQDVQLNEEQFKEKFTELSIKYKLDLEDKEMIEIISRYLSDAIILDNTRYVNEEDTPFLLQKHYLQLFKTNTAKRLIKSSYCMQDELARKHLKEMKKIDGKLIDEMRLCPNGYTFKKFFKKELLVTQSAFEQDTDKISSDLFEVSPIMIEAWFKYYHSEIRNPLTVARNIEEKTISEYSPIELPLFSEQEIGKNTIRILTSEKDKAKKQIDHDEQIIVQQKNML